MKKHLLLLLGILLALPGAARDFNYTYEGQTITYTVLDEEAKTVETKAGEYGNPGNNVSGNLILPSVVLDGETEYTLTKIGHYTFFNCSGLTSVTIPNSVISIGSSAFSDCSGLTSVTIPNSVISIGSSAFSDCSGLTSVTIPNSVTEIGERVFSRCSGLTSGVIGNSVESIGICAFYGCSAMTSVVIGNSVATIGQYAFYLCSSLESIDVEEGNKNYCSLDGVLFNFDKTDLLKYPEGKVGHYNIPNSVTYIGISAFSDCSGLTSVTIPNSVTEISEKAFSDCTGLTSITVEAGNTAYASLDGVLFNKDLSTLIQFPGGCTGKYSIPNSVTSIGEWAFSSCSGLTSIEIPNSVTSIGSSAFYDCSGLTSVTIPNSVTSIGNVAFKGCI